MPETHPLFPRIWPDVLENPSAKYNIHEQLDNYAQSPQQPTAETEAQAIELLHCNVEMLVIILKNDEDWKNLQASRREGRYNIGATSMSVRKNLRSLLQEHFRQARECKHAAIKPAEDGDDSTLDTSSLTYGISADEWDNMSSESCEFIMGGVRGQGLEPITYKEIDTDTLHSGQLEPREDYVVQIEFV